MRNGCGGTSSSFGAGDEFIPRYTNAGTHTWVVNNRMVNEVNWQWARQTDTTRMARDYTPSACNQTQTVLGGQTLGCTRYVFPSFSWGYSQCLPPCMQSPGTTTPFKDIYEALSVSAEQLDNTASNAAGAKGLQAQGEQLTLKATQLTNSSSVFSAGMAKALFCSNSSGIGRPTGLRR